MLLIHILSSYYKNVAAGFVWGSILPSLTGQTLNSMSYTVFWTPLIHHVPRSATWKETVKQCVPLPPPPAFHVIICCIWLAQLAEDGILNPRVESHIGCHLLHVIFKITLFSLPGTLVSGLGPSLAAPDLCVLLGLAPPMASWSQWPSGTFPVILSPAPPD